MLLLRIFCQIQTQAMDHYADLDINSRQPHDHPGNMNFFELIRQ